MPSGRIMETGSKPGPGPHGVMWLSSTPLVRGNEQGVRVSALGCRYHICEVTAAAPDSEPMDLAPPCKLWRVRLLPATGKQCPAPATGLDWAMWLG